MGASHRIASHRIVREKEDKRRVEEWNESVQHQLATNDNEAGEEPTCNNDRFNLIINCTPPITAAVVGRVAKSLFSANR